MLGLQLVAAGHTSRTIASSAITRTVRKHLENIFSRLGVACRTEAIAKSGPAQQVTEMARLTGGDTVGLAEVITSRTPPGRELER
jgi:Bacterial regulatory proteins, luxR family